MRTKFRHTRAALILWTAVAVLAGGVTASVLRGAIIIVQEASIHQMPACPAPQGGKLL